MIIPTGFGQVTLNFAGNGLANPGACVFGIDQAGGVAVDDAAENIYNAFSSTILTRLTDDITLTSCLVKFGPNTTGPSAEFSGTEAGGLGGSGATSNTAYLVRKNTALGGREGRGRMYLPGVQEASVGSDGLLDTTARDLLQDECDTFRDALGLLTVPLVLLHNSATAPTAVTGLAVQARAATQRRRLRR